MKAPDNEILTLEEVAAYLRLTPQTIYKWAQEQRIPAAKLGKEWRFRALVLDPRGSKAVTGRVSSIKEDN